MTNPSDAQRPRWSIDEPVAKGREGYLYVCGMFDGEYHVLIVDDRAAAAVCNYLNALETDLGRAREALDAMGIEHLRLRKQVQDAREALRVAEGKAARFVELLTTRVTTGLTEGLVLVQHHFAGVDVKLHKQGDECEICALTPVADAAEEPTIKIKENTGPQVSNGWWLQRPRLVRRKSDDAAEGGKG